MILETVRMFTDWLGRGNEGKKAISTETDPLRRQVSITINNPPSALYVDGDYSMDDTSVDVDDLPDSLTSIKIDAIFTIPDHDQVYTVTGAGEVISNAVAGLTFIPALVASVADNTVISINDSIHNESIDVTGFANYTLPDKDITITIADSSQEYTVLNGQYTITEGVITGLTFMPPLIENVAHNTIINIDNLLGPPPGSVNHIIDVYFTKPDDDDDNNTKCKAVIDDLLLDSCEDNSVVPLAAIKDITRDEEIASKQIPINLPALYVIPDTVFEMDGEVSTSVRDTGNMFISLRYVTKDNIETYKDFQQVFYTLRAINLSLNELMKDNPVSRKARTRYGIHLQSINNIDHLLVVDHVNQSNVFGALLLDCYIRDVKPKAL